MPDSQKIIENPSRFDSGITEGRQNNSIVKRGRGDYNPQIEEGYKRA
jgi:hypothetical protein